MKNALVRKNEERSCLKRRAEQPLAYLKSSDAAATSF